MSAELIAFLTKIFDQWPVLVGLAIAYYFFNNYSSSRQTAQDKTLADNSKMFMSSIAEMDKRNAEERCSQAAEWQRWMAQQDCEQKEWQEKQNDKSLEVVKQLAASMDLNIQRIDNKIDGLAGDIKEQSSIISVVARTLANVSEDELETLRKTK